MAVSQRATLTISSDPTGPILVLKDSDPSVITGGHGGWNVVARPKKKSLTQWVGVDPYRISLPILFDGWKQRENQEYNIAKLLLMATPASGKEPPLIAITGVGVPAIAGVKKWVIENITWGTNVIWATAVGGNVVRLRQDAVLSLLEYVAEDRTALGGVPTTGGSGTPGSGSTSGTGGNGSTSGTPPTGGWYYGASKGEKLTAIAQKFWGTTSGWEIIGADNNIRGPVVPDFITIYIRPKP